MAKYGVYGRQTPSKERPYAIHPVWRGIGCIMIVLIPIMAYAGGVLLVQANRARGWLPVPQAFARSVELPVLGSVPYLYANLAVAIVLALAGFVILTVLYAIFYRLAGPPSLGPTDASPEWGRSRRRR
jgi:hypothetical protein